MGNEKAAMDETIDYLTDRTLCEVSQEVLILWQKEQMDLQGNRILMTDDESQNVLGSDISRDRICAVTFVDTLEQMPQDAWDVSKEKDGSV